MNLKKIFAALLAVAMLLSCLPFAASAANEPSVLYVGEKDKTDDNLIPMLDAVGKAGNVRVYAIDRNTQAYYTLTYEKNVGYVLTFYNDYTMSELIDSRSAYCGLYCDGDRTVRIAGNVTFNADDEKYKGAIGWIVEGKLTIENALYDENGVLDPYWTLLATFESKRPSGETVNSLVSPLTDEERQLMFVGEEFEFPDGVPAARYVRVRTIETWGKQSYVECNEITLFGIYE